tara:strand:- start:1629 stop:2513 length:885 start_codon:yes stop_codon:yes gene_type:complete
VKIKKEQLQRIIKEELDSVLSEGPLDKFLRRRKIKKQGGYEWDDFSSEQKDSLRRAMDFEDPDMTKADLEISKKQTREKVQADLETFKQERDAKKKAEEEARRKTRERVKYLKRIFAIKYSYGGYSDDPLEYIFSYGIATAFGGLLGMGTHLALADWERIGYRDSTVHSEFARTWIPAHKRAYMQRTQKGISPSQRVAVDRSKPWEERVGPIAIEVEKMSKEEIYEKIKYIKPKNSKPIPEFYKRAVAEQISEMSVTEIEQVLKDEWTMKKAFKRFEINPAEDLKIKKDDSIYK